MTGGPAAKRGLGRERERQLNRAQAWGFVIASVGALLTYASIGILLGLGAAALGHRYSIPAARTAGAVSAFVCAAVVVLGLTGDGGGLLD